MAPERWEPFDMFVPLRDAMTRLFEESVVGPRRFETFLLGRGFPIDIIETEGAYTLEAALPGVQPDELNVTVVGDTITIRTTTKQPEEQPEEKPHKKGAYVRRERFAGEVSRAITLPTPIVAGAVTATYAHGILTLRIPKAEAAKPKQIAVQVEGTANLKEPAVTH